MGHEEDTRLLMAELLEQALTNLRAGSGWNKDTGEWLKPFFPALQRYLRADPDVDVERQRAALVTRIDAGLSRLPPKDRELIEWVWNRSGRLSGTWTNRRLFHPEFKKYKSLERRFDTAVRKLVAAMLPAPDPPPEVTAAKELSDRARLNHVLAYRRDWYRKRLDVSIYVEPAVVTVRETWDIAASVVGAQHFAIRRQFYWAGTQAEIEVTEGAELAELIRPNDKTKVLLLRFAEPAFPDARRRFVVTYRTHGMAPVYSSGFTEFDGFTTRLQFRDVRPSRVWLIEHFATGLFSTENIRPVLERYAEPVTDQVDAVGYYMHEHEPSDFTDEGIAWELPDTHWRARPDHG